MTVLHWVERCKSNSSVAGSAKACHTGGDGVSVLPLHDHDNVMTDTHMAQCSSIDNERMTSSSRPVVPADERCYAGVQTSKFVSTDTIVDGLQVPRAIHLPHFFAKEPFDCVLQLVVDLGSSLAHNDHVAIFGKEVGCITNGNGGLQLVSGGDPDLDTSSLEVSNSFGDSILQLVLDRGGTQQDKIAFDGGRYSLDPVFTVLQSNTGFVELLLPFLVNSLCDG
jgi:hypothetical protein